MRRSRMPRTIAKRAGPACAANPPTWWNNAQGLNPCDVYQAVMDKCGYTVPAISNNDAYYPVSQAQLCMCNTIAYNLGSACQDCQRGTTDQGILMSVYETGGDGCVTISTDLPDTVNPTEDIPTWARLDTSTQFWSYTAAQQIASNSSTTTSETITATTSGEFSATMVTTPTPTGSDGSSSPTEPASSSSKSTNAGAIGGGVAGGVVLVLLVIGLLLFLRRRRARDSRGGSNVVMGTGTPGRNASVSSESSLTESGKAPGSSSHYTPHSQMTQLHHNGSGINVGSYSTSTTSALTTPVEAPAVPPIPREFATSPPPRSLATSPTLSVPSVHAVQKVKRVPVRYSEDELAQAEEEARRVAQHHS